MSALALAKAGRPPSAEENSARFKEVKHFLSVALLRLFRARNPHLISRRCLQARLAPLESEFLFAMPTQETKLLQSFPIPSALALGP